MFIITTGKQLSENSAPCFNNTDFIVTPAYIELPWFQKKSQFHEIKEIGKIVNSYIHTYSYFYMETSGVMSISHSSLKTRLWEIKTPCR